MTYPDPPPKYPPNLPTDSGEKPPFTLQQRPLLGDQGTTWWQWYPWSTQPSIKVSAKLAHKQLSNQSRHRHDRDTLPLYIYIEIIMFFLISLKLIIQHFHLVWVVLEHQGRAHILNISELLLLMLSQVKIQIYTAYLPSSPNQLAPPRLLSLLPPMRWTALGARSVTVFKMANMKNEICSFRGYNLMPIRCQLGHPLPHRHAKFLYKQSIFWRDRFPGLTLKFNFQILAFSPKAYPKFAAFLGTFSDSCNNGEWFFESKSKYEKLIFPGCWLFANLLYASTEQESKKDSLSGWAID